MRFLASSSSFLTCSLSTLYAFCALREIPALQVQDICFPWSVITNYWSSLLAAGQDVHPISLWLVGHRSRSYCFAWRMRLQTQCGHNAAGELTESTIQPRIPREARTAAQGRMLRKRLSCPCVPETAETLCFFLL